MKMGWTICFSTERAMTSETLFASKLVSLVSRMILFRFEFQHHFSLGNKIIRTTSENQTKAHVVEAYQASMGQVT